MKQGPVVDDRSRQELLAELRSVAQNYTGEWDPNSEDMGTTVFRIFSRFQSDIVQRLNEVPEKHRFAFLDALDFSRRPPQTARGPLTFRTVEDIDQNVVVPGGTQAVAEVGEEDQIFEVRTDSGFEATAATLEDVYSVDPSTDSIYDHTEAIVEGEETTLFTGEDLQDHVLYLGDEDLLNLNAGSSIAVTMVTNASAETIEERLAWEYYGENDDGEVGWHELPQETTDIVEEYSELGETTLTELRETVRDRIRELYTGGGAGWRDNSYEVEFAVPGTLEEHEVDGIESRWLRARIVEDHPSCFEFDIDAISLRVDRSEPDASVQPDATFANDVPLDLEDENEIYPYGRRPQPPASLYLACEEAFSKEGAKVEIEFAEPEDEGEEGDEEEVEEYDEDSTVVQPPATGALAGPPDVSWEYWNGGGWTKLTLIEDETSNFQDAGTVSFEVPDDLQLAIVAGHEEHWVRARLVGGNYGQPSYEYGGRHGHGGQTIEEPDPPLYGDITIQYTRAGEQFEHVVTLNNTAYSHETMAEESAAMALVPFDRVPDEKQTLYLGFDAPLHNGPINFHLSVTEATYPRGFDPGMRWEYCTIPDRNHWEKLEVKDGTEGLMERGITSINFPDPTQSMELFGMERHWLRIRATGDEFVPGADTAATDGGTRTGETSDDHSDQGSKSPPSLRGIFPNTQWVYNHQTVEDEVLGSSDSTHEQSFECDNAPVVEIEVWVDEADALSQTEQRELEASDRAVERLPETGPPVEFWVKWSEVDDFLESGETDRHYRVDRTSGTVTFGDGERGMIPPSGTNNLRVTYKTGGGSDGNVEAGEIADIQDPIGLVDEVENLKPSDGGADVESMDEVAKRAPRQLKNRGKAVTPRDFEQVAEAQSRDLARVKCEPELDDEGNRTPGWVTLLILPREQRERPKPSLELRQRVRESISDRAPATLVGHDRQRIVVRGPNYATVSVDVTVNTPGVESVTSLKSTIESELGEFLHPITGGQDGEGWTFGEPPRLSQVSTVIESVDGVDSIDDILMTIETGSEKIKVRLEETIPDLDRDIMISNGTHEVDVSMIEGR